MSNNIRIGQINNNPLCGLCERVCVEVKTIIDGCRSVYENTEMQLTLSGFSSNPTYPLTFDSLYANGSATLENLSVTPTETQRSRVRFTAILPVTVYLTDANGILITATSTLTFYKDVLLNTPSDPMQPYAVEVAGVVQSSVGNVVAQNVVNARVCMGIVTRITQKREIVIPTYGDCVYPTCRDYQQNCSGLNNNPTFSDT